MYHVYDNGISADYTGSCSGFKDKSGPRHTSKFATEREAIEYAIDYLGAYGEDIKRLEYHAQAVLLSNGFHYSGAGDIIRIKWLK